MTKAMLTRVGEFFRNVEKKKLIVVILLAAVVVGAGIIGAVLLNRVQYTVLYSGLEASEAGTIKTLLDEKGVISKAQGTNTILVPEDQADELRIQLASEGYPNTGLNYDIFSSSSALGSTDLERRTYLQYQLQENMRTTISRMEKVQDCIVIVNLASESSFVISDASSRSSVAVMLDLKNDMELSNTEAKTIGEFVMKCVPELQVEDVSIVDSKMNYYDIVSEDEASLPTTYSADQQQMTEQMKNTLTEQVLRVLEPAIGNGNVAVSVNLNLDFDKETVSKVEFKPPIEGETDGLVRSSEELYNAVGSATEATGQTGTDTNGVGTPAYVADTPSTDNSETSYTKTYNYELNQIQTEIEKNQGTIQDLSVAVLVNSNVEGVDAYSETVKNLVAQAIGVTAAYISVEMMPFVEKDSITSVFEQNQQTIQQISQNKLITTIVTVLAVLAAAIIIVKFFVKKSVKPTDDVVTSGLGRVVGVTAGDFGDEMAVPAYDMSDLVMKKSTEAEKIEELMDRYPETVAQILRTWLAEDN